MTTIDSTKNPPFTITYHTVAQARPPVQEGVLEDRWLHKLFLLGQIPASWNALQIFVGLLCTVLLAWLIWSPFGEAALRIAKLYYIFALADWLLLWWLPHTKRSFGPIGSQLFVLIIPRLVATVLGALIGVVNVAWGEWFFFGAQLFGTLTYVWGMAVEPFLLRLAPLPIYAPQLPANTPPIRLLHLSDLHIERLTRREAHLLTLIEQADPDLIVITGDYTNLSYVNERTARAEIRKFLALLHAPCGVYVTLGSPPADPRATTPALFDDLPNIRLLRDEVVVIRFDDGRALSLLGMDCEHDVPGDMEVFKQLLNLAPVDSARVLLYHSPELMPEVQTYPLNLYLCGHTHGGQVRLPFYGALITSSVTGKRYELGVYTEQQTTLSVSPGIGLEGLGAPRLRLLCPPKAILVTLSN